MAAAHSLPTYAAYSPASNLYMRRVCHHCGGSGYARRQLQPMCRACRTSWRGDRFDLLMEVCDRAPWYAFWTWLWPGGRNRYRWHHLPCGHSVEMLRWKHVTCYGCNGTRFTWHAVRIPPALGTPPVSAQVIYRPQSSSGRNPVVPRIRTTRPLALLAQQRISTTGEPTQQFCAPSYRGVINPVTDR